MTTALLAILLLLGAAGLALTLRRMRGERPARLATLAALRLAALCALAAAIVGPTRERQRTLQTPAQVALLVDTSQSMGLPSGAKGATRLQAAGTAGQGLERTLARAPSGPRLQMLAAAEDVVPLSALEAARPTGRLTDLRAAVRDLAAGGQCRAAALLSDGDDTAGARAQPLAQLARTAGLSLAAVGVGQEGSVKDIAVDRVRAPRRLRANSEFELSASIRTPGFAGERMQADLSRGRAQVRSMAFTAAAGQVLKTRLRAGAPGRYRYAVSVPRRDGELSAANNTRSVLVQVVPDKPTVLLIAGQPSQEYASLKRILLADKALRARVYVRKAGPSGFWRDDGKPGPAQLGPGDLERTKAVLLQDVPAGALGALGQRLARFVREGGGLGVLAGPSSPGGASFAEALPMQPGSGGFVDEVLRPQPTRGADSLSRALDLADIPFGSLPSLRGRSLVPGLRRGATAALTANGAPVLAGWELGKGRALVLATNSTYRWTFSPEAGDRERRALEAFWGALVDWLTELRDDRPVVAEFDRDTYQSGTPARLIVQVTDSSFQPVAGACVVAQIGGAGTAGQRVACAAVLGVPGRYEATIPTAAAGGLRVIAAASYQGKRLGSDEAEATVVEALTELAAGRPNLPLLKTLGEAAGGGYATADTAAGLAGRLSPAADTIRRTVLESPARGPSMVALLLALWGLDWGLRRRWQGA